MGKMKINFGGLHLIFGTLKDGLFIQLLIFSCWNFVSMTVYEPVFNDTPVNVTYYTGETATLKCSISHLGPSKVIWKREDQPHALTVGKFVFVSDPKYSIKHIPYKYEWNLVIEKVTPEHAGFYECQISTKDDMKRHVKLNVIDEEGHDRRYINITGAHTSTRGHTVRLTCNVSGFRRTPKHIRWYLNGTHLINGWHSNVRIVTYQRSDVFSLFSELDIGRFDNNYVGYYTCKAEFDEEIRVAKHYIFVDNADAKQSKRGTVADGIESQNQQEKRPPVNNAAVAKSVVFNMWPILVIHCIPVILLWL